MSLSNNDKQIRFRKKEWLKKEADRIWRDWQFRGWRHLGIRSINDTKGTLDEIVDLKPNWTEEDYNNSLNALYAFQLELYDNPYALQNDVMEARDCVENLLTTDDPKKLIGEQKKAVENMKNLSSHIISAISLAKGTASDSAAAVVEALRFVGHSLIKESIIPRSQATAICLAILGPQYGKPEWFYKKLGKLLLDQLGEEEIEKLIDGINTERKKVR